MREGGRESCPAAGLALPAVVWKRCCKLCCPALCCVSLCYGRAGRARDMSS